MSQDSEKHLVVVERDETASHVAAFLVGAVIGAGIALLFAPQSGAETQRSIRDKAKQLGNAAGNRVRGAQRQIGESLEAARDGARERLESVKDAVDVGRKVAGDARRDLEEKLTASKEAYRAGVEAAREELAKDGGDGAAAEPS